MSVVESPLVTRAVRASVEPRGPPHFPSDFKAVGEVGSANELASPEASSPAAESESLLATLKKEPCFRRVCAQWILIGCLAIGVLLLSVPWTSVAALCWLPVTKVVEFVGAAITEWCPRSLSVLLQMGSSLLSVVHATLHCSLTLAWGLTNCLWLSLHQLASTVSPAAYWAFSCIWTGTQAVYALAAHVILMLGRAVAVLFSQGASLWAALPKLEVPQSASESLGQWVTLLWHIGIKTTQQVVRISADGAQRAAHVIRDISRAALEADGQVTATTSWLRSVVDVFTFSTWVMPLTAAEVIHYARIIAEQPFTSEAAREVADYLVGPCWRAIAYARGAVVNGAYIVRQSIVKIARAPMRLRPSRAASTSQLVAEQQMVSSMETGGRNSREWQPLAVLRSSVASLLHPVMVAVSLGRSLADGAAAYATLLWQSTWPAENWGLPPISALLWPFDASDEGVDSDDSVCSLEGDEKAWVLQVAATSASQGPSDAEGVSAMQGLAPVASESVQGPVLRAEAAASKLILLEHSVPANIEGDSVLEDVSSQEEASPTATGTVMPLSALQRTEAVGSREPVDDSDDADSSDMPVTVASAKASLLGSLIEFVYGVELESVAVESALHKESVETEGEPVQPPPSAEHESNTEPLHHTGTFASWWQDPLYFRFWRKDSSPTTSTRPSTAGATELSDTVTNERSTSQQLSTIDQGTGEVVTEAVTPTTMETTSDAAAVPEEVVGVTEQAGESPAGAADADTHIHMMPLLIAASGSAELHQDAVTEISAEALRLEIDCSAIQVERDAARAALSEASAACEKRLWEAQETGRWTDFSVEPVDDPLHRQLEDTETRLGDAMRSLEVKQEVLETLQRAVRLSDERLRACARRVQGEGARVEALLRAREMALLEECHEIGTQRLTAVRGECAANQSAALLNAQVECSVKLDAATAVEAERHILEKSKLALAMQSDCDRALQQLSREIEQCTLEVKDTHDRMESTMNSRLEESAVAAQQLCEQRLHHANVSIHGILLVRHAQELQQLREELKAEETVTVKASVNEAVSTTAALWSQSCSQMQDQLREDMELDCDARLERECLEIVTSRERDAMQRAREELATQLGSLYDLKQSTLEEQLRSECNMNVSHVEREVMAAQNALTRDAVATECVRDAIALQHLTELDQGAICDERMRAAEVRLREECIVANRQVLLESEHRCTASTELTVRKAEAQCWRQTNESMRLQRDADAEFWARIHSGDLEQINATWAKLLDEEKQEVGMTSCLSCTLEAKRVDEARCNKRITAAMQTQKAECVGNVTFIRKSVDERVAAAQLECERQATARLTAQFGRELHLLRETERAACAVEKAEELQLEAARCRAEQSRFADEQERACSKRVSDFASGANLATLVTLTVHERRSDSHPEVRHTRATQQDKCPCKDQKTLASEAVAGKVASEVPFCSRSGSQCGCAVAVALEEHMAETHLAPSWRRTRLPLSGLLSTVALIAMLYLRQSRSRHAVQNRRILNFIGEDEYADAVSTRPLREGSTHRWHRSKGLTYKEKRNARLGLAPSGYLAMEGKHEASNGETVLPRAHETTWRSMDSLALVQGLLDELQVVSEQWHFVSCQLLLEYCSRPILVEMLCRADHYSGGRHRRRTTTPGTDFSWPMAGFISLPGEGVVDRGPPTRLSHSLSSDGSSSPILLAIPSISSTQCFVAVDDGDHCDGERSSVLATPCSDLGPEKDSACLQVADCTEAGAPWQTAVHSLLLELVDALYEERISHYAAHGEALLRTLAPVPPPLAAGLCSGPVESDGVDNESRAATSPAAPPLVQDAAACSNAFLEKELTLARSEVEDLREHLTRREAILDRAVEACNSLMVEAQQTACMLKEAEGRYDLLRVALDAERSMATSVYLSLRQRADLERVMLAQQLEVLKEELLCERARCKSVSVIGAAPRDPFSGSARSATPGSREPSTAQFSAAQETIRIAARSRSASPSVIAVAHCRSPSRASTARLTPIEDGVEERLKRLLLKENQEKHELKAELELLKHQQRFRTYEQESLRELFQKGLRRTFPLPSETLGGRGSENGVEMGSLVRISLDSSLTAAERSRGSLPGVHAAEKHVGAGNSDEEEAGGQTGSNVSSGGVSSAPRENHKRSWSQSGRGASLLSAPPSRVELLPSASLGKSTGRTTWAAGRHHRMEAGEPMWEKCPTTNSPSTPNDTFVIRDVCVAAATHRPTQGRDASGAGGDCSVSASPVDAPWQVASATGVGKFTRDAVASPLPPEIESGAAEREPARTRRLQANAKLCTAEGNDWMSFVRVEELERLNDLVNHGVSRRLPSPLPRPSPPQPTRAPKWSLTEENPRLSSSSPTLGLIAKKTMMRRAWDTIEYDSS